MSNSSEARKKDAAGGAANAGGMSSLLDAIADELARTASDVAKLGELLSDDMIKQERLSGTYDLQAFDTFSQAVQAQANLLKRLAEAGADWSRSQVTAMIEDVPFSQVRRRLKRAACGASAETLLPDEPNDTEVSWF